MKKNKDTNPIILRKNMTIGKINAEEDDEFLFDTFITYSPLEKCINPHNTAVILSGRTGAGKTAILRYIEHTNDNIFKLDPTALSIQYIANSNAIDFAQTIGCNLDLLFQTMWRHILCIEYIKIRWNLTDQNRYNIFINKISDIFIPNNIKNKAIEYIKNYSDQLYLTVDENVKTITENFENKINASLKLEIEKFGLGGQYDKRLSNEKKIEYKKQIDKILDSRQMADLHAVIELLRHSPKRSNTSNYFLTIDQLDLNWADDSIVYRLIRALIVSLKPFQGIPNLKILVALRDDILEKAITHAENNSFQREKYEDYFVNVTWKKNQLRELVDKRIQFLFHKRYSHTQNVSFEDIFTTKIKNKNAFDYIVERTLMRPRDIIAFINECFSQNDNLNYLSNNDIIKAEKKYSRQRKDALIQEWYSLLPSLEVIFNFISSFKKISMPISDLCIRDKYDQLVLDLCLINNARTDPICVVAHKSYDSSSTVEPIVLIIKIVSYLYRIGAVGLKLHSSGDIIYSHIDNTLVNESDLNQNTQIRIHKMLHAAFHLNEDR